VGVKRDHHGPFWSSSFADCYREGSRTSFASCQALLFPTALPRTLGGGNLIRDFSTL
jgi:hypothetical protein